MKSSKSIMSFVIFILKSIIPSILAVVVLSLPMKSQEQYHRVRKEVNITHLTPINDQIRGQSSSYDLQNEALIFSSKQNLRSPQKGDIKNASTFFVTTVENTGEGSFRKAILDANANPGIDIINFNINGGGSQTIAPLSPFPVITDPVLIDATTQPGFTGSPIIQLDGSLAGIGVNGLVISAGGSLVRGLVINRFKAAQDLLEGNGIVLQGGDGNVIEGCYIGTDATGMIPLGNEGSGIRIHTSGHNLIGGTTSSARNVISGNRYDGIQIPSLPSISAGGNVIQGNFIGVDATGNGALSNGQCGVGIFSSVNSDTIGGTSSGARNVISGNQMVGIYIDPLVHGTVIQSNYIGTDVAGNNRIGSQPLGGIYINSSPNNIIGGETLVACNVISGNAESGIQISGNGAQGNAILGNYIGTNSSGTDSLGNAFGVLILGASNNNVAGKTPGARNIISGNLKHGIYIKQASATDNVIEGNFIGTNLFGQDALGNLEVGVLIDSAASSSVSSNLISGNGMSGIYILGASATWNKIYGNYIGVANDGATALPNLEGISIYEASHNLIGGTTDNGNLIAFNAYAGVFVSSGTGNLITKNWIFLNGGLGIDLAPEGITPNDQLDIDVGANNLQNFPVIDKMELLGTTTRIYFTLMSEPNTGYDIDFYVNSKSDLSKYGEGEDFLGSTSIMTSPSGIEHSTIDIPSDLTAKIITATATDFGGNTSEFSRAFSNFLQITHPQEGDLVIAGQQYTIRWIAQYVDNVDILFTENFGESGEIYFDLAKGIPADQGYFVWDVDPTILSRKCNIYIEDSSDPSTTDSSGRFKVKGYVLTKIDANDDYVEYKPSLHDGNL